MSSNVTRQVLAIASANYEQAMSQLLPSWDWPCSCAQPGEQLKCLQCPGFRLFVEEMQANLSDTPKETFVQVPSMQIKLPYSEEIRQNCIWLYERGHCLTRIQELTGVTNRKIIRNWLVDAGLMIISLPAHEHQRERCLRLYQQGMTPSEVEDITRVPADMTAYWASYADILHPKPVFTDTQKEECLKLYLSGHSAKTVEHQTGVPAHSIKEWVKKAGIKRQRIFGGGKPRTYTEDDKQRALALFQKKYATQQVEEITGFGAGTLRQWLKEHCQHLLDAGWTPAQVEEAFGIGHTVLIQWWGNFLENRNISDK